MNSNKNNLSVTSENNIPISLKEILRKYMHFWPWFLLSVMVSLFFAMNYLRYTNNIYKTITSVKIIGDNNQNEAIDFSKVFNKSSINLDNEKAIFKSYRLSEKLVRDLNLNINYVFKGTIKESNVYSTPFVVKYKYPNDSIKNNLRYTIKITNSGYFIVDENSKKSFNTNSYWINNPLNNIPITIHPAPNSNILKSIGKSYGVSINTIKATAIQLSKSIGVELLSKESDILTLSISGTDQIHSEKILNELIKIYEEDGIKDKQEVYKKTISFVDDRFVKIKKDLDSIEEAKKSYKTKNELSFLESDATSSLGIKNTKDQVVYDVQMQLSLANMLKEDLDKQTVYNLLPDNIGLQNGTINGFVDKYNTIVLQFQKMNTTAGSNNPSIQSITNTLSNLKININKSVQGYIQQLQSTINKSELADKNAQNNFATIPEKEKILRSIERQQNLKENLYLLLLQKREEASINKATAISNVKVIDYAISESNPISPKRQTTYLYAILLGLFIPFGIIYIIFSFDDKIHKIGDVEKLSKGIPILSEIPDVLDTKEGLQQKVEAFRTLVNNTNFVTPFDSTEGKLIFVTSAKKGEGKTFIAYNLAASYASLEKKTILIGTDFRNPQLHKHLQKNRNEIKGLSNYLHKSSSNWRELLYRQNENDFEFDILLAGDIPPNPTLLLSSERLKDVIDEFKKEYDIIIFDTAPSLLVSDSLIISKYADTTLFVFRSNITEKQLVQYAVKLTEDEKINNTAFVLNGINFKGMYGYNYSYSYGYGYGYNYGYGYGYGLDEVRKKWYKRGKIGSFVGNFFKNFSKNV
jgi:capsular exopolysaccharide synthesis family protein